MSSLPSSLFASGIRARLSLALVFWRLPDPRLLAQIVGETDAVIGGTLHSDALSAKDGPASTYLDTFRHNVGAITEALGS